MNEIYTGKTGAILPPIQIHPPSMGSVLDMLNVINGILYVQIRYVMLFIMLKMFKYRQNTVFTNIFLMNCV